MAASRGRARAYYQKQSAWRNRNKSAVRINSLARKKSPTTRARIARNAAKAENRRVGAQVRHTAAQKRATRQRTRTKAYRAKVTGRTTGGSKRSRSLSRSTKKAVSKGKRR